jgi:hypothetical protein
MKLVKLNNKLDILFYDIVIVMVYSNEYLLLNN